MGVIPQTLEDFRFRRELNTQCGPNQSQKALVESCTHEGHFGKAIRGLVPPSIPVCEEAGLAAPKQRGLKQREHFDLTGPRRRNVTYSRNAVRNWHH